MSPVMLFTVTIKPTIFWLLKVIEHFYDICFELLLWWRFYNGLAFQKRPFVTPERVTQGKKSSMIIKESDFSVMLQPKCIRVIHTY
jgi:hypothetical protein